MESRWREAREYLGLTLEDVSSFLDSGIYRLAGFENDRRDELTSAEKEKLARLYRRPMAWLRGEPTAPVEIAPDLDRLMERLSEGDRIEVARFAEWLQHGKETAS